MGRRDEKFPFGFFVINLFKATATFTRATFSCENLLFAFFLSEVEKETKAIEKKKGKMQILNAKSGPSECSLKPVFFFKQYCKQADKFDPENMSSNSVEFEKSRKLS